MQGTGTTALYSGRGPVWRTAWSSWSAAYRGGRGRTTPTTEVVGSIPTGGSTELYEPGSSLTERLELLLYAASVDASRWLRFLLDTPSCIRGLSVPELESGLLAEFRRPGVGRSVHRGHNGSSGRRSARDDGCSGLDGVRGNRHPPFDLGRRAHAWPRLLCAR